MNCIRIVLVGFLALASGCQRGSPFSNPQAFERPDSAELSDFLSEMEYLTKQSAARHVLVYARDIELPPTPSGDEPVEERLYTFYVIAQPPDRRSLASALTDGSLRVDVVGAAASIEPIRYPVDGDPTPVRTADREAIDGAAIRITISSKSVSGPITISAWFIDRFQEWEERRNRDIERLQSELRSADAADASGKTGKELIARQLETRISQPNPFGDTQLVRVFSGDLHTSVVMLSETEIRQSFGKQFAKYFFVGRVYLRNRHESRKLVVNTTSLRARCLFYRNPDPTFGKVFFGKESEKRYEFLKMYTPLSAGAATASGLTERQVDASVMALRKLVPGAEQLSDDRLQVAVNAAIVAAPLTSTQSDELEEILTVLWGRLHHLYVAQLAEAGTGAGETTSVSARRRMLNQLWTADDAQMAGVEAVAGAEALKAKWLTQIRTTIVAITGPRLTVVSPIRHPLQVSVSPTAKRYASSPGLFRQGRLAATGYLWEDYYRPMPFEAVLISLLRSYDETPVNQILRTLESIGVAAGAIVGVGAFGSWAAGQDFASITAVSTGVFLPEARKLLLEDIDQFLTNLGSLGLDAVIELEPNSSRDGYVFFPRGPIFGFGVDEFTIDQPSFIVNIDNEDVAIDGILVERSQPIVSGVQAAIDGARDRGRGAREKRDRDLAAMQERLRSYSLAALETDVAAQIAAGNPAGARHLIAAFEATYGPTDLTGTIARLRAGIDQTRAGPAIVLLASAGALTLDGVVRVAPNAAGDRLEGSYLVHLSRAPAEGAVVVTIRPGVENPAGLQIAVDEGTLAEPPARMTFAATADSATGATAWHASRTVRVSLPNPVPNGAFGSLEHTAVNASGERVSHTALRIELK